MKWTLVTGGAGFIGSHLIEALSKQKKNILCLDNFNDFYDYRVKISNILEIFQKQDKLTDILTLPSKNEQIHELTKQVDSDQFILLFDDICHKEKMATIFETYEIETIIHLAGMAGVRPSIEEPLLYEKVNIQGTLNILEEMRKHNLTHIVFASSSSVYGNNKKVPFAESDFVDFAVSPYAASKKSCETFLYTYHHLYKISVGVLRFFTVYGPRQRPDLAIHKFIKAMNQDKAIPFFGDGSTSRDYTYVTDIINGILHTIDFIHDKLPVFEIFNLGNSSPITLSEMTQTIEKVMNKKFIYEYLPLQDGDVNRTFADISKAKQQLAYHPKVTFEDGIKKFIIWHKERIL